MGYSFLCPFAHSSNCQILAGAVIEGQGILSVDGSGNSVLSELVLQARIVEYQRVRGREKGRGGEETPHQGYYPLLLRW